MTTLTLVEISLVIWGPYHACFHALGWLARLRVLDLPLGRCFADQQNWPLISVHLSCHNNALHSPYAKEGPIVKTLHLGRQTPPLVPIMQCLGNTTIFFGYSTNSPLTQADTQFCTRSKTILTETFCQT